jgi:hypothetical protein
MCDGRVVAWIDHLSLDEFEGAFVAEAVPRKPAKRTYATVEEARRWIEREAAAIAAPIKWLEGASTPRH